LYRTNNSNSVRNIMRKPAFQLKENLENLLNSDWKKKLKIEIIYKRQSWL